MKIHKNLLFSFLLLAVGFKIQAKDIETRPMVTFQKTKGSFPLIENKNLAFIYTENNNNEGVKRAINDLKNDISLVSGMMPEITSNKLKGKLIVIAGTIGENAVIDELIQNKKINVDAIKGTWENHFIQVVKNPFAGVESALVIAGSDKRGTIYGIYTLSESIGVSPWYWWADVPVKQHQEVYVHTGKFSQGSPAVKYRGIFLNDEAPALSGWSKEKFGGFNHKFYEKVFELILRLKGNYLWPAMWGNAFYDDDPQNAVLANEYGIVIGTSHHEPLMRAHDEWRRYGKGAWNYNTNPAELQKFWKDGIQRMGKNESIISVGMRGDGDEPMSEDSNIALLEKIVADQREIIKTTTGKNPADMPQLWALYKEVQDYYDKGMRVPDDITLLLCDDNWGNIRKLPQLNAPARKGGYGVYYHFDYVGGPRNYKWINTNPITKIWEQMNLAYEYDAKEIWIVNVGDLKPMEFPISFFLDFAWNPKKWPAHKLQEYTEQWTESQFGKKYAQDIAAIISTYSKFNGRRKPELINEKTYSLTQNREFETVVKEYNDLLLKAQNINQKLDAKYQDAFYQLVLHPVQASANLNELYFSVAKNQFYAKQNRISANDEAQKVKELFLKDSLISVYYNKTLAGGKWNHFMDQTHIGYTYWQQPPFNTIPKLETVNLLTQPQMGVSLEGSLEYWPKSSSKAVLPEFNKYSNRTHYIDIFNQGNGDFNFTIEALQPWINLSAKSGTVSKETRVNISINWNLVPSGDQLVPIKIQGANQTDILVYLNIKDYGNSVKGFIPDDEILAIEANHFSAKKSSKTVGWEILPDHGKTHGAVTPLPVTAATQIPGNKDCPVLEYKINITTAGKIKIATKLSPSLDFQNTGGLKYAISIDDEKPQIVNINLNQKTYSWDKNVADHINTQYTFHDVKSIGAHTVKIWMVDAGIVIQKLVISPEKFIDKTYLGPTESVFIK